MQSAQRDSWRFVLLTDMRLIVDFYAAFLPWHGHRLVGLLTSAKRNPAYLDVIGAAPVGVDVILSDHRRRWAAMLAPLKPDLIISQVFPWLIPGEVLALPHLGVVNLHGGLLPEQRGTDTFLWMLREGARETGLTMHRVAAGFDTGPLLGEERVPLDDDDDQGTIIAKLSGVMPALWATALPRIARGDAGEQQDEARARYLTRIPDGVAWKTID